MGINIIFKEVPKDIKKVIQSIYNQISHSTNLETVKFDWDIYIYPLDKKEQIHNKYMTTPYQGDRSYRALTHTNYKKTFIFLNEGENSNSIAWVLAHELSHINILQNNYINAICKNNYFKLLNLHNMQLKDSEINLKNDEFHDSLLEEQIANAMATDLIGKDYGREWWRKELSKIS